MKTMAEMRDATKERVDDLAETGKKAAYALVGAPVVAGKHIADYAGKGWKTLQQEFEAWVTEGERLSSEVREGKVVTEIKERVDFDHLQGRVEKLKDQLEDVLANWRDTFKPEESEDEAAGKHKTEKATAKKTASKKTTSKKAKTGASAEEAAGKDDSDES